jgi:hypothetical protein
MNSIVRSLPDRSRRCEHKTMLIRDKSLKGRPPSRRKGSIKLSIERDSLHRGHRGLYQPAQPPSTCALYQPLLSTRPRAAQPPSSRALHQVVRCALLRLVESVAYTPPTITHRGCSRRPRTQPSRPSAVQCPSAVAAICQVGHQSSAAAAALAGLVVIATLAALTALATRPLSAPAVIHRAHIHPPRPSSPSAADELTRPTQMRSIAIGAQPSSTAHERTRRSPSHPSPIGRRSSIGSAIGHRSPHRPRSPRAHERACGPPSAVGH